MSTFSGPQGRGAMRLHRDALREEAKDRQVAFNARVQNVVKAQDVSETEARAIVGAHRSQSRGFSA